MRGTQLSRRQIQAGALVFVAGSGAMLSYVFTVLPTTADPVGSHRIAVVSGVIAVLAALWFAKLMIDGVNDWRRGVVRGPAKVTGRFDVVFGAIVAIGGITCSGLTFWSASAGGAGIWTLYYGMILWGVIQIFMGYRKLRHSQ